MLMFKHVAANAFNSIPASSQIVRVCCPSCRRNGTLEPTRIDDLSIDNGQSPALFGQRLCPNPDCRCHIFFVMKGRSLLVTYPPERIDFDATALPPPVINAFEEAITCHSAGAYTAAAIMVRKTLEEMCIDRGASGKNLKEKLTSLGSKIIVPKELIEGADELRLLGNDAAHIEAQAYTKVGADEVSVGIEFAKELLKACYQYTDLLARLRALKKPAT